MRRRRVMKRDTASPGELAFCRAARQRQAMPGGRERRPGEKGKPLAAAPARALRTEGR